jgi:integrase
MEQLVALAQSGSREPWNKGKLVGQKAPLQLKEIWAIRIRLQLAERTRELALFNLAVDSKLRSCDLVTLRVRDITHGERIAARAIVMQQKTQRPVQFEITQQTRDSITTWIHLSRLRLGCLRHTYLAADEGVADLSTHEESARRAAAVGPLQTREHCAIPRYRSRRRARDGRTDGSVIVATAGRRLLVGR